MKRARLETVMGLARRRSVRILAAIGLFYIFIMSFEVPFVFKSVPMDGGSVTEYQGQNEPLSLRNQRLDSEWELLQKTAPLRPLKESLRVSTPSQSGSSTSKRIMTEYKTVSGLQFDWRALNNTGTDGFSELHKIAMFSFQMGEKFWKELRSGKVQIAVDKEAENRTESCPNSITLSGADWSNTKNIMVLPCGLTLGSHITLVAKPRVAHAEYDPKISMLKEGDQSVMVSQFMMELLGLKTVDGEEPPRILHFNPRLKGDWTEKPVIEQNTCYRQQWGSALRCEGWKSKPDEETVDSMPKCEKWIRDNDDGHEEVSKTTWWLTRLIRRKKKVKIDWPFPFSEDKLFVLTLSAGLEGYHINVDGRHVTSFPYRTGFSLEDATGLTVNGDIDVHSVFAASLPSTHPSFAPQRHLEMSFRWQAPPLPSGPTDLFIGILSAGNHFAERMAVRKTWMQHKLIKSSKIVARFFVALHARKEVNAVLLREAKFFGDIVIVPYMDTYDLVVIKTVAICEYGVRTVSAKYIMKCDDDTFVHIDAIMNEVRKIPEGGSLYIGNINYYHRPLRYGKWAVTYEEWPEEVYPPYANGPGYVLSSDIAHYVVSEFENHKLRLFKMEDVSMGMWVERFNSSIPVHYVHSLKFCQFGCIEDYYTAHYQSPKQMICLWNKLQRLGSPLCCNMR